LINSLNYKQSSIYRVSNLIHIYFHRELQNEIEKFTKLFKITYDTGFEETSPELSVTLHKEHIHSFLTSNFFDRSNKFW